MALREKLGRLVLLEETESSPLGREYRAARLGPAGFDRLVSVLRFAPAVSQDAAGAMFMVCDQPDLTAAIIDHLLDAFAHTNAAIVVPTAAGRRGSPVTFRRRLFTELAALEGDGAAHGGRTAGPQYVWNPRPVLRPRRPLST